MHSGISLVKRALAETHKDARCMLSMLGSAPSCRALPCRNDPPDPGAAIAILQHV